MNVVSRVVAPSKICIKLLGSVHNNFTRKVSAICYDLSYYASIPGFYKAKPLSLSSLCMEGRERI